MYKLEVYQREDGKWAWRVVAANHKIVASDANQGYENRNDAYDMARAILDRSHVVGGEFVYADGRRVALA
jgi:uncharacterized protein YegP (UPF0339 family)